jgi:hypothetical protein
MHCTKMVKYFFAMQHNSRKTAMKVLLRLAHLLAGNLGSAVSSGKSRQVSLTLGKPENHRGQPVLHSLWTTILSIPGGLDGSHLLQTGVSPSATILTAVAAFLLLLTKI